MNTSFAAAYQVWVELGLKSKIASGVRGAQAQLGAVHSQARKMSEETTRHLQRVARQAERYGYVWGNPKTLDQAKKNLSEIHAKQAKLINSMALSQNAGRRAQMQTQLDALKISERENRARAEALRLSGAQVAAGSRASQAVARDEERARLRAIKNEEQARVRSARTSYRIWRAQQNEENDHVARLQKFAHGSFKVAQAAGIGALGIGSFLGLSTYEAAKQQSRAATSALALGYSSPADLQRAQSRLMGKAVTASMAVGLLSSSDVASIQTTLIQHLGLRGGHGGLRQALALTLPVAKFADVMKQSTGTDVQTSASVATRVANQFGVTNPKQLASILQSIFVMSNSTGAPLERFMNALSYFGAMGKSLGFSPQAMISLYGESYRLGIGGGKSGQRLGAIVRGLTNMPTTFVQAAFSNMLGVKGNMGLLPQLTDAHGNVHLVSMLRWFNAQRHRLVARFGLVKGRDMFVNALNKSGMGASASMALLNLISSPAIQGLVTQQKRAHGFMSVDAAQSYYLGLPINELARFKTNLTAFLIQFGRSGLPLMTKMFASLADSMQSWTLWAKRHPRGAKDIFSSLFKLGEDLAILAGVSGFLGMIANISNGIKALGSLTLATEAASAAMGEGRLAMLGPLGLVAAIGLVIWQFRNPLTDAIKHLAAALRSIPIIGGFFGSKKHWGNVPSYGQYITNLGAGLPKHEYMSAAGGGPHGLAALWAAVQSWYYNQTEPQLYPAASTHHTHYVTVQLDGKEVGRSVLNSVSRGMPSAFMGTTPHQGTTWSPYGAQGGFNASLAPHNM